MRLQRLFLRAFGPFSGEVLDFRAPSGAGLHVIFGPNEAGKSTSLRAVRGLLFGIPNTTKDDHLHPSSKLCVGGEFAFEDRVATFFRYKKRTASLLDENGKPASEEFLRSMLGGLDENTFSRRIGFDQAELDLGAEALLGGSEEGLFAAGTGGAEVRLLLEELKRKSEDLYKKQGKNPTLNKAIGRFLEAKKIFLDNVRLPDTYERQRKDLESAESDLGGLVAERRRLREEQRDGNRLLSVLADLAAFREEEEGLARLGEVVLLPEGATEEREELLRELRDVEVLVRELDREQARIDAAFLRLAEPSLLEGAELELGPLEERLGSERKAMDDVPKLRARLAASEADLLRAARRLGFSLERDDVFDAVDELLPPESGIVGVRAAHAELSRREEAQKGLTAQVNELAVELAEEEPGVSEGVGDITLLQGGLADGQAARGAIERARELHQQARVFRERLDTVLAALPGLSLTALARAPTREQLDSAQGELSRLSADIAAFEKRKNEARKKRDDAQRELSSQLGSAKVLRETDLSAARERRDAALEEMLLVPASSVGAAAFRALVLAADVIADHLRNNAQALSRLEELERRFEEEGRAFDEATSAVDELCEVKASVFRRVREAYGALGLSVADDPEEWRRIEGRLAQLATISLSLRETEAGFNALKGELEELEERLRVLVRDFLPDATTLRLSGLIDALAREVEARVAARQAGELRERQRMADGKRLLALQQRRAVAAEQYRQAEEALGERLQSLGLPKQLRAEELEAVLRGFGEMQQRLHEGRELKRRVDGIDRDSNALATQLEQLSERFGTALITGSLIARGDAFVRAVREARATREERGRLLEERRTREQQAIDLEARRARAEHRLSLLAVAARVTSPDELPRAEERSEELRRRTVRSQNLREKIIAQAGGESFASLVSRAKTVTQAELSGRLDALGDELEQLEEVIRRLESDVSSLGLALDRYRTVDVADARQKVATRAAEARGLIEEFVKTELARQLLSDQMEAFARSFTGPLAERSSEIFSTLTLGKYSGLEFGLGDRTLRCRRGTEVVEVNELSRGTRAQLYFALRVASLESYFSKNRVVPLVLDDLFVDFDDDRATSAFEVLGRLAERTQILYFTHLSRDVELASSAVARLGIHRLGVS